MKASIGQNGKLTVEAETPLESYALGKWIEDYNQHQVVLLIITDHTGVPGASTIRTVQHGKDKGGEG